MIDRKALEIRHRKGVRQLQRWMYRPESITADNIGFAGTTPVPCSCFMCGNYRRTQKGKKRLTLQERRALLPEE
jgi:hypothetical protein